MRTQRIQLDDIEISCLEAGSGARPLVMVHGLTGHRDDFCDRLPELAAEHGRVLAPDLRGHGGASHTGRAETFTFEQLLEDLLALLDVQGIEQCDLLGHSFGGMVALRFVLEHPDRVASFVAMNTAPFAPEGYDRSVFEKAGAIAVARGMEFLQELVEKAARAEDDPKPSDLQTRKWGEYYYEHHRKRYAGMDPVAYRALGLLMMDQEPMVHRLDEIDCPTTVLIGTDDEGFQRGAEALAEGVRGAKKVTLEDAGHHPHIESTGPWSDAIRAHLERARSPAG